MVKKVAKKTTARKHHKKATKSTKAKRHTAKKSKSIFSWF